MIGGDGLHPMDLVFIAESVRDLVYIIKNTLLQSNKVGLLKFKFKNIIIAELLKKQEGHQKFQQKLTKNSK